MKWYLVILFLFSCTPSKTVYLDGRESYSPEGSPLTFHWRQIGGRSYTIGNKTRELTTTQIKPGLYAWELTVTDSLGFLDKDTVYYVSN